MLRLFCPTGIVSLQKPKIQGVREVTNPQVAKRPTSDSKYICNSAYGGKPHAVRNDANLPRQSTLVRIMHFGLAFS